MSLPAFLCLVFSPRRPRFINAFLHFVVLTSRPPVSLSLCLSVVTESLLLRHPNTPFLAACLPRYSPNMNLFVMLLLLSLVGGRI